MKKKKYLKRFFQLFAIILILPILVAFLAITCYKKELTELFISNAKTIYGLDIHMEQTKVSLFENWPQATIEVTDVHARSSLSPPSAPEMFQAQSISVSFNLLKLLNKRFVVSTVSLKHGTITLVKDKSGNKNYKLSEHTDTAKNTSSLQFDLRKIKLEDMQLHFRNEEQDKHIGVLFRDDVVYLHAENKIISASISGSIKIDELLFKRSKGPFLKNAEAVIYLNTSIYPAYKSFFVDETSYAIIDEEKYSLVSFVQLDAEKKLTLKIDAPEANFKKGLRLMNTKIQQDLARTHVSNPVAIHAIIVAPIGKTEEPQLYVTMSGINNNITIGNTKIPYEQVSFTGYLRSWAENGQEADLSKGEIVFKNIKGFVYDFPFTATATIHDLKDPRIHIKAGLLVDGSKIKFKPGTDFILKGFCKADIDYTGDMQHLNSSDFLMAPQQLLVKVNFKKFSYQTGFDQPAYVINGNADGLNKDIKFKRMKLETVGGDFEIEGNAINFVPYALGYVDGFNAAIHATTEYMNLTPIIAKSFNSDAKTPESEKVSRRDVKRAMEGSFAFTMSIFAKKLSIRFINATDATIEMNYAKNTIEIKKLTMKTCNGTLSATGHLKNFAAIQAHLAIKNMNVKTMFEQFENFGQSTISSDKLLGTISLTADMNANLNEKFQLQAPDLNGEVQLKLKDGHLLNFEPLKNIGTYFRNRDFTDITFSEINQKFKIKGTEMDIQNMEIASSVLNLYIDGIYNFKGQTDLNLRIPLSNFKKRDKDYIPQELGKEGRTSKALRLNAHGFPNKIKISLGAHSRDTTAMEINKVQ
jgi:hypothetical protein